MRKKNGSEPTQETQPAKGDPVEIPIPTREEVLRDLAEVAKPRRRARSQIDSAENRPDPPPLEE
jgi:hypothetical protein